MKSEFSKTWNSSVQPRKQRKFIAKAPLHIRSRMMNAHLSKELRTKYGKRSIRVITGDKVKILKGKFKGTEEKVESANMTKLKIYVSKVEATKRDGSKARVPVNPSNVVITELNLSDKKRKAKLEGKNDKKPLKKD